MLSTTPRPTARTPARTAELLARAPTRSAVARRAGAPAPAGDAGVLRRVRRAGPCVAAATNDGQGRAGRPGQAGQGPGTAPPPPSSTPVTARWLLSVRFGSRADVAALLADWVEDIATPAGLPPGCARVLAGAVGAPDGRLELELRLPSLAALEALWAALPPGAHRAWGERLARHIEGSPRWEVLHELGGSGGGRGGAGAGAGAAAAAGAAAPAAHPPPPPPPPPGAVGTAPLSPGGIALVSSPGDVDAVLSWGGGAAAAGAARGGRPRSGDVLIPAPWAEGSGGKAPPSPPPPASVGQRAADDTPYGRSGGGGDGDDDDDDGSDPTRLKLGPRPDGSRVVLDWKGDPLIIRPGDNLPGL